MNFGRRQSVLAKEGVLSANELPLRGKIGRASSINNILTNLEFNYLEKNQWIPLGEGWFQV